jgi:20S proteasome alpha/beta subunit
MTPKPRSIEKMRFERKPQMTFIAGLQCTDGIILCSDSLESDGYNKKNVQKLFTHEVEGKWGIGFGCSGSAAACTNFSDRLLELIRDFGDEYDRRGTEKIIEAAMAYMRREYSTETLEVVVGMWSCSPLETRLYRASTHSQCISVESDYVCAGLDTSLARFLLDSIITNDVTVFDAMYIAAFVISIMKEKADGVGGPTQMVWHHCNHEDGRHGVRWAKATKTMMSDIERGGFINGELNIGALEKNIRQFCWSRFPHQFVPESDDD